MSADEKLIENLEIQLARLVEQLQDLEECKNEISPDEYDLIKSETLDQIKEFESTLDRLQKGNISLDTKLTVMKSSLREAIAKSFNTNEMIKIFDFDNMELQLLQIEEDFMMKQINQIEYDKKKRTILLEMHSLGKNISPENLKFINLNDQEQLLKKLEEIHEE